MSKQSLNKPYFIFLNENVSKQTLNGSPNFLRTTHTVKACQGLVIVIADFISVIQMTIISVQKSPEENQNDKRSSVLYCKLPSNNKYSFSFFK